MQFSPNPIVIGNDELSEANTAIHTPGQKAITSDGRGFVYGQVSTAANAVPGTLYQGPATVSAHVNMTPAADAAVGDVQVQVTLGAAAVTKNQYKDGLLVVSTPATASQGGRKYTVFSHPAADASANLVLTLYVSDSVQALINSTSRLDLVANEFRGAAQVANTGVTGALVGAAVYPIQANNFGWFGTTGKQALLIEGTPAIGDVVSPSANTNGAVGNNASTAAVAGRMVETGVNGKYKVVDLSLGKN